MYKAQKFQPFLRLCSVTHSSTPIRACDSRNLNLNPFCNLVDRLETFPWTEDVKSLYRGDTGDQLPDYIQDIGEAVRPGYKYTEDEQMDVLLRDKVRSGLIYADDSTVIATGDDTHSTTTVLNKDLEKIHLWSKSGKCNSMLTNQKT